MTKTSKKKYAQDIQGDIEHLQKMRSLAEGFVDFDIVNGEYLIECIDDWIRELEEATHHE